MGQYPPPPGAPDILGLEVAGRVAALGAGSTRFKIGDAVTALIPGGGYAEYCCAAEICALPVPQGLSMIEAGAVPETFFTVWANVFQLGALKPGESLLVHGGTSGIGTTAIMLAKAFGARVFTTAGSTEKCAAAQRLGAERAIHYKMEDFVAVVKAATDERGVDVVLDMVGGDYVARNIAGLAPSGRHVSIATLGGNRAEIPIREIMAKRLTLTGSTLRPRSVAEKGAIAAALEERVWPLLAGGRLRPVIDSTFPLAEAAAAHRRMEAGTHIGKIVLTLA
jgi:NADPH2:quinone reductase